MDKWFYPTLYNRCHYLSMLGLKLVHIGLINICIGIGLVLSGIIPLPVLSIICDVICVTRLQWVNYTLIPRFMGPTWGPSGDNRTQVGPKLAPWSLISGYVCSPLHHVTKYNFYPRPVLAFGYCRCLRVSVCVWGWRTHTCASTPSLSAR